MILMLVLFSLYLLCGQLIFHALFTKKGRAYKKSYNKYKERLKYIDTSIFNDYKKLEIESWDKLKLYGFYKDNNSDKLAILVHGFGSSHLEMANYIPLFEKHGYDVLAPDNRGHGESQGYSILIGEDEKEDLLLWITKMIELKPNIKIVLYGVSAGGTIVALTVGENYKNVVLAIEDSGFDNADKMLRYLFSKKYMLKPFYKLLLNYMKKTKLIDLRKIDAIASIKKCKIPMLFIHGEKDSLVPIEMAYNMHSQLPEQRSTLFIVSECEHASGITEKTKIYENEVRKFLSKYYM